MGLMRRMRKLLRIDCNVSSTQTATRVVPMSYVAGTPCLSTPVYSQTAIEATVDEEQFKSHAEKEFWEQIYIATIRSGIGMGMQFADTAVQDRRARMSKLTKTGVKAA